MLYRFVKYGDSQIGTISHESDYSFFSVDESLETHATDGIALARWSAYKTMRDAANEAYAEYARQNKGKVSCRAYRRIRLSHVIALSPLQKEAASRNWLAICYYRNMDLLIESNREYF